MLPHTAIHVAIHISTTMPLYMLLCRYAIGLLLQVLPYDIRLLPYVLPCYRTAAMMLL